MTITTEPDTLPDPVGVALMVEPDMSSTPEHRHNMAPAPAPLPAAQPVEVETQDSQTRRSGRVRTANTRLTGYELFSVNHGVLTLSS